MRAHDEQLQASLRERRKPSATTFLTPVPTYRPACGVKQTELSTLLAVFCRAPFRTYRTHVACLFYLFAFVLLSGPQAVSATAAGPWAQGYGRNTAGGRLLPGSANAWSNKLYFVDNLNDAGPGSLRAAVNAEGCATDPCPRMVIFRTGGEIALQSHLILSKPYITIAGQTAPADSDGVVVTNQPLRIATHDVIVRHIRLRPGDRDLGKGAIDWDNRDGLAIGSDDGQTYNVLVDHVSISWGVDENVQVYSLSHDVTIQNSIIAEGLADSRHSNGVHSKGMLIAPGETPGRISNLSIHHNIFANNLDRHPLIGVDTDVEFINNVVYSYRYVMQATNIGNCVMPEGYHNPDTLPESDTHVDVIGNYYRPGLRTELGSSITIEPCMAKQYLAHVYLRDNIPAGRMSAPMDQWAFVRNLAVPDVFAPEPTVRITGAPLLYIDSVAKAYKKLVVTDALKAGASLPRRDSVDSRILNDVRNQTGVAPDSPAQVGGLPTYRPGTPPRDSDGDGLPNAWEIAHGLDPSSATSINGAFGNPDKDPYPNIEEYMNNQHPRTADR